MKKVNCMNRKL